MAAGDRIGIVDPRQAIRVQPDDERAGLFRRWPRRSHVMGCTGLTLGAVHAVPSLRGIQSFWWVHQSAGGGRRLMRNWRQQGIENGCLCGRKVRPCFQPRTLLPPRSVLIAQASK